MAITLSSAVRTNLLSLQSISSQQSTVQNRLATGKKVNSALDNATSFFTASAFTSRASSLSSLQDSISTGVQTLQAANNGITAITSLVSQLRSTGQQALQSTSAYSSQAKVTSTTAFAGATSADLRGSYKNASVTGATAVQDNATTPANITGSTKLTAFATANALVDGDKLTVNGVDLTFKTTTTGAANEVDIGTSSTTTVDDLLKKIDGITGATTASTVDGTGKLKISTGSTKDLKIEGTNAALKKFGLVSGTTDTSLSKARDASGTLDGKTLSFTVKDGGSTTVTFGDPADGKGAIKSLDDLNTKLADVGLSASLDSTGNIAFTTTSSTASKTFTLGGSATTVSGSSFATTSSSAPVRGGTGADSRDALVTQYNSLLSQIDSAAKDANFNGLNLLSGDTLSLIFNEKNTSKLDVNGTSANSTGLGLSTISASDFNDGTGINSVLSKIDGAKNSLATQASKFGSNLAVVQTRQDFTKQTINTLNTGADNLTNADLNEEATNLLSLNTSQSLAQQALSLANSAQQSVLQLLR